MKLLSLIMFVGVVATGAACKKLQVLYQDDRIRLCMLYYLICKLQIAELRFIRT